MKFDFTLGVLGSLLSLTATSCEIINLWKLEHESNRRLSNIEPRNRRLETVGEKFYFDFVASKLDGVSDEFSISFDIPENGEIKTKQCDVKRGNPLVSQALADKFPDLAIFKGHCANGEEIHFSMDTTRPDGMSAMFFNEKKNFVYIDSASENTNEYVIYNMADALSEGTRPDFKDEVIVTPREEINFVSDEVIAARKQRTSTLAYNFKLAIVANNKYSQFHGNTKQSVMQALITLMTRVNGVYMHEFGTYFTFHDDQDLAICINGSGDSLCDNLPNDSSIINRVSNFLASKGIPYASYDMGHSVTTGSGGLAAYPALCTSGSKASATTGMPEPINDPFAIDYVAHEMGHQVLGAHSFRYCAGPSDGNLMIEGAVEPGSASSIMGYAGICGSNDLQPHSDPYFNNLNQQQMYDYISGVQNDGSCGQSFQLNNDVPVVSAPGTCVVPVGNNFQLQGTSQTEGESAFFSWDRVDTAIEDFDSTTLGKFRSWKPTESKSRFFPNLYFLNNPQAETKDVERLPSNARSMTFRFTERKLYESNINAPEFDLGIMGDFNYVDTRVNFQNVGKMTMTSPVDGATITSGESVTFTWAPGGVAGLQGTVEVYIAENTFVALGSSTFDYEVHNKELNWVKVGEASTTASTASFVIPAVNAGAPGSQTKVNLMLRAGNDACFFFDLKTGVTLVQGAEGTQAPTTLAQTPFPTPAPVVTPATSNPTPFPIQTSAPTKFPTESEDVPPPTFPPTQTTTSSPAGDDDLSGLLLYLGAGLAAGVIILSSAIIICVVKQRRPTQQVRRVQEPVVAENALGTKNMMYDSV